MQSLTLFYQIELQIIYGFGIETFNAESDLYTDIFKQTIAGSMKGVLPENIIDLKVTA